MDLAIALVATGISVLTLYASWRRPHRRKALANVSGWLTLGVAATFWVRYGGVEYGVAYTAMALSTIAWLLIGLTRDAPRRQRHRPRPYVSPGPVTHHALGHAVGRAFVAIPLAGLTSLLACVAMIAPLAWVTADRYVLAIMLSPILWGGLSVWAGMTSRLVRTAAVFSSIAVAASAILLTR